MFINPKLLPDDTLNALIEDWLFKQAEFENMNENANMETAREQVKQMLKRKTLVISFAEDDELDVADRINIQPVENFGLTPNQVEFDEL